MARQAWKVLFGYLHAEVTQEVSMGRIRKNPAGWREALILVTEQAARY